MPNWRFTADAKSSAFADKGADKGVDKGVGVNKNKSLRPLDLVALLIVRPLIKEDKLCIQ